jgi:mannobiose 2-epimerase
MQRGRSPRITAGSVGLLLWACSSADPRSEPPGSAGQGGRGGGEVSTEPPPRPESVAGGASVTGEGTATPIGIDGTPNAGGSSVMPVDGGADPVNDAGADPVPAIGVADASVNSGNGPQDPLVVRLDALSSRLKPLAERTFAFWFEHGPDAALGGFHATLDRAGSAIAPVNKGLVQQARHLWSLCTWYERRERRAEIAALARSQYTFLTQSFLDAADGAFVLSVSPDGGRVVDARKQLYAESFALYALSTYGRVFDVPEATGLALERFASIDASRHDARFGGYDQRGDPGFLSAGAEKDTNTHLHLMEAFSALYEATGDARVGARLDELAGLVAGTLRQRTGYVHAEFTLDWTPFGTPRVSYGHDLETAWLLVEAARVLGRPSDPELRAAALAIVEHSATRGIDLERGGYFESGIPQGAATDLDKIWWVQLEALAGLWWAYELSGDTLALDRLEQTTGWLETTEDLPSGEWFASTNPDGSAAGGADYKGDEWKESYHSVRALVFVQDWVEAERARLAPR